MIHRNSIYNYNKRNTLLFYKSKDGNIQLNVKLDKETVWLTLSQMSNLFEVDRTVNSDTFGISINQ